MEAASRDLSFPKSARVLRSSEFRRIYDNGVRVSGPYFSAFCLADERQAGGPKVGFTLPRALGKSVVRNRIKRRLREVVRMQLWKLKPNWQIVINPRRAALTAPFAALEREVEKVFSRCNG